MDINKAWPTCSFNTILPFVYFTNFIFFHLLYLNVVFKLLISRHGFKVQIILPPVGVTLSYIMLRLFLVHFFFFFFNDGNPETIPNPFALSYPPDNHLTFLIPAPLLPPHTLLVNLVVWTPYIALVQSGENCRLF